MIRNGNWLTKIPVTCPVCDKVFYSCKTKIRHGRGKYCSRQCLGKVIAKKRWGSSRKIVVNCSMCGKSVEKFVRLKPKSGKWYCSWACRAKSRRKQKVERTCKHCGKTFLVYPHRLNLEKYGYQGRVGSYCSMECLGKDRVCGGPGWRGGISFLPYAPDFNDDLKTEVKSVGACSICGSRILRLNAHHIDYDKQNSAKSNLTPLCDSCHGVTNFNREYWTSRLQGHRLVVI